MRNEWIITTAIFIGHTGAMAQGLGVTAGLQAPAAGTIELARPGDNRAAPPVLIDASKRIVGAYFPASSTVVLKVQEALIPVAVTSQVDVNTPFEALGVQSGSTYRWAIKGQTWFLSSDCSGPPIPLADGGLRPVAYLQDLRTGVLTAYIGGTGLSSPRPANSARQPTLGSGPFSGQCLQQTPFGGTIQGFDVEQVVNVSQRFAEPLSVR